MDEFRCPQDDDTCPFGCWAPCEPVRWTMWDELRTRWWMWLMAEGTARRAVLVFLRRGGRRGPGRGL